MRHTRSTLFILFVTIGCIQGASPTEPHGTAPSCTLGPSLAGVDVPACLRKDGRIGSETYRVSDSLLRAAVKVRDSLQADTGIDDYYRYVEMVRALGHVADFYNNGQFPDSVRFDRIIDHVAVTAEYVRKQIVKINNVYYPRRTPFLGWTYYQGYGFYFQPVNTVQQHIYLVGSPNVSLDSLQHIGEAMWSYAVWHDGGGRHFPRWEYDFPWYASGAVWLFPPWESAMAQGVALELFTELYRDTHNPVWQQRAQAVFVSFRVSMDNGGALLPDSSHGYWWEEYHPRVMVWNGSVNALLTVGDYAKTLDDTLALRMWQSGLGAIKYFTPRYDTGTWTYYSLTGYLNTKNYHNFEVQELDLLYGQTQDIWFKNLADKWRAYVAPAGVQ